jgi:hypothetical protein
LRLDGLVVDLSPASGKIRRYRGIDRRRSFADSCPSRFEASDCLQDSLIGCSH